MSVPPCTQVSITFSARLNDSWGNCAASHHTSLPCYRISKSDWLGTAPEIESIPGACPSHGFRYYATAYPNFSVRRNPEPRFWEAGPRDHKNHLEVMSPASLADYLGCRTYLNRATFAGSALCVSLYPRRTSVDPVPGSVCFLRTRLHRGD